jgi:HSP20 family molecular chaperone IbpA
MAGILRTGVMKQPIKIRKAVLRSVHQDSGGTLREQIPLRDMSDCLLAVYDEVSRRAFQRCVVRGEQEGSDREDWKAAENELFARISVDFEESSGNLYALASLPGCAGTEITVAVDECWLLICGYTERGRGAHMAEDFCEREDSGAEDGDNCCTDDLQAIGSEKSCTVRDQDSERGKPAALKREHHDEQRVARLRAPRPFCVVALRAKVDPERSVAVLSNGLLAIRMGKAGLKTPVPRVA